MRDALANEIAAEPAATAGGSDAQMTSLLVFRAGSPHPKAVPLALVTRLTLEALGVATPDWRILLRSTIPVSSGLGSGAAAATAIVRAIAAAAGRFLTPAEISALVFESERLFHGTPSGIDNTVVAYEQPVWFVRGQPPEPFAIARPVTLVIGDTGIASPTSVTVGDVRGGWQAEPAR